MPVLVRITIAVFALAAAYFCAFGFLATFEGGDWLLLRIIYVVGFLLSLSGAVLCAWPRREDGKK